MRSIQTTLVAVCMVTVLAACSNEPSAPEEAGVAVVGGWVRSNLDELPDSSGNCRSGYAVVNGRCVPIPEQ
jgi:hypothetical protein